MRLYGLHIILIFISIFHILYIHLEPNPPSNLSAVMTCDAKGYKVYTEWKVCYPNSKSTIVIKLSIYSRATKDSYVGMTAHDKISSQAPHPVPLGSPLTGYLLYYHTFGDDSTIQLPLNTTSTSYMLSNVTTCTFNITVAALSETGPSRNNPSVRLGM